MIAQRIEQLLKEIKTLSQGKTKLIAVSKTYPATIVKQAYDCGLRDFGENRVQELLPKHETLPPDIDWHLIGHLQANKTKYIAPFVQLIHSVDSLKLLQEIDKQAQKNNRIVPCLLQMFIAQEETKFGLSHDELFELLDNPAFANLQHIRIKGLMGMASNTDNETQIRKEFKQLRSCFERAQNNYKNIANLDITELSMGMSNDYRLAIDEGSTMVRLGSKIFGR